MSVESAANNINENFLKSTKSQIISGHNYGMVVYRDEAIDALVGKCCRNDSNDFKHGVNIVNNSIVKL